MNSSRFEFYKNVVCHSYQQLQPLQFLKNMHAKGVEYYYHYKTTMNIWQCSTWYSIGETSFLNALGCKLFSDFFFPTSLGWITSKYLIALMTFNLTAFAEYQKTFLVPPLTIAENTLKKADELIFSVAELLAMEQVLIKKAGYDKPEYTSISIYTPMSPDAKRDHTATAYKSWPKALVKTLIQFFSISEMAIALPSHRLGLAIVGILLSYIFYLMTLSAFQKSEDERQKVHYRKILQEKMALVKIKIDALEEKIGTAEHLRLMAAIGQDMTKRSENLAQPIQTPDETNPIATKNNLSLFKYSQSVFKTSYYVDCLKQLFHLLKMPAPILFLTPLAGVFFFRNLQQQYLTEKFIQEISELNLGLARLALTINWGKQVLFHEHEYLAECQEVDEKTTDAEVVLPISEFDMEQYFLQDYEKLLYESPPNLSIPSFSERDTMRFFSKGKALPISADNMNKENLYRRT